MSGSASPYVSQFPDSNILRLGDSAIPGSASSGRERGAGSVNGRGGGCCALSGGGRGRGRVNGAGPGPPSSAETGIAPGRAIPSPRAGPLFPPGGRNSLPGSAAARAGSPVTRPRPGAPLESRGPRPGGGGRSWGRAGRACRRPSRARRPAAAPARALCAQLRPARPRSARLLPADPLVWFLAGLCRRHGETQVSAASPSRGSRGRVGVGALGRPGGGLHPGAAAGPGPPRRGRRGRVCRRGVRV